MRHWLSEHNELLVFSDDLSYVQNQLWIFKVLWKFHVTKIIVNTPFVLFPISFTLCTSAWSLTLGASVLWLIWEGVFVLPKLYCSLLWAIDAHSLHEFIFPRHKHKKMVMAGLLMLAFYCCYLFVCFGFLRQGLAMSPMLCNSAWSWTLIPPASAFQVLGYMHMLPGPIHPDI
jgi:hypothetical protein